MRDLEILDVIALLSLFYQMDSNKQLMDQSTNDDILNEISGFAEKITTQNARIIELLEELRNDVKKNV